jgi:Sulfotransferase family
LKDFYSKIPLIGVGPARTASTWLYHVLVETKRVERPRAKEMSYFNIHYDKSLWWYQREFTEEGHDYWIDVTPQYIDSLVYCKRIYDQFPNAYVFIGIRDPVDRIRSLFKLYYYNTRSERADDYDKYLQEELPKQIIIGNRVAFLHRMFHDRLVAIRYEALKRDSVACAKQVLSRCGIAAPPPAVCNYVVNSLHISKDTRLASFGKSWFRSVGRLLPPALAWRAKIEIGERLLMREIRLERFLEEKEFQRVIGPHLAKIERDQRLVDEILGQ